VNPICGILMDDVKLFYRVVQFQHNVTCFKFCVLGERKVATHCGASCSLFVTSSETLRGLSGPGPDFSCTMFTITLLIIIKALNIAYLLPSSGGSRTVWTRQHIIFSSVLNWRDHHYDLALHSSSRMYFV
jgi:hypothetical protein